jgi:hypothetical protein
MSNQEPTTPKRFLTEVEVSALTGIPKMTLRSHRHLRRGLPYVKVGHLVRYDCVEVEKYLAERTIRPENPFVERSINKLRPVGCLMTNPTCPKG